MKELQRNILDCTSESLVGCRKTLVDCDKALAERNVALVLFRRAAASGWLHPLV
jgi:hypothetical protein